MSRVVRAVVVAAVLGLSALAGVASADEVKSQAKVRNEGVTVESVTFADRDDGPSTPGHQVAMNPGGNRRVVVSVNLTDGNGGQDIKQLDLTLSRSGENGTLYTSSGHANGVQGRNARWEGTFDLPYTTPPGTYLVNVAGSDRLGASASGNATFEVLPTLGFRVQEAILDLADSALQPGSSTHATPSSLTVENRGNVKMDLRVGASALAAQDVEASLPASSLHAGLLADLSDEQPLSESGLLLGGFDLAPGEGSTRSFFVDIHVPSGDEQYVPAAVYKGKLTVSAEVDA